MLVIRRAARIQSRKGNQVGGGDVFSRAAQRRHTVDDNLGAALCAERAIEAGVDAMVGILHEVGRAVEAFSRASPTSADLTYCEDHSYQLEQFATKGAMHAWLCYGEGNGNVTDGEADGETVPLLP